MQFGKTAMVLTALGACALASACEGVVDRRGYRAEQRDVQQIQIGTSTEQDVLTIMGTPTVRSTFDENTWYYIGSETETWAFMRPELVDRNIIEVQFDPAGYVAAIETYGAEIAQDIDPVDRETPTRGNRVTFIQQFLGNLGRFNK
ncbi:MAG: outer membrane protein assembly factor BamE [Alphaproteobacteria bacterium]